MADGPVLKIENVTDGKRRIICAVPRMLPVSAVVALLRAINAQFPGATVQPPSSPEWALEVLISEEQVRGRED